MNKPDKPPIVPKQYLLAFILTTCCFSLWGFANDFTNPLVQVFKQIFVISTGQAAWLQFAFYTGYFCMAIPAVMFIRKFSYKAAILLGLSLYGIGALITIPASLMGEFALFCLASYIITYGLAFLETACNPYILSMGSEETSTQRLNLAQSFNPIGSLIGMAVASQILAPSLMTEQFRNELHASNPEYTQFLVVADQPKQDWVKEINIKEEKATLTDDSVVTYYADGLPQFKTKKSAVGDAMPNLLNGIRASEPERFSEIQQHDLGKVRGPYVTISIIVFAFMFIFFFCKLPDLREEGGDAPFFEILGRLMKRSRFVEGVFAQLFYVGAQIMCWTFIIQYGIEVVGLSLGEAQQYNIISMTLFLSSRFICTFLMRYIRPSIMLFTFAIGAIIFTLGAIYLPGKNGLISLVLVSGCMSLMFPTIYGISLKGLKIEEAKLGSAFLIMSIVGGAFLTKLQGTLIDISGARTSFWLVAGCFVMIALYGLRCYLKHDHSHKEA